MSTSPPVIELKSVSIVGEVRLAPFALVLLAALTVSCGDDDGGPTYAADVSDEQVAVDACGLLVTWTNDVTDAINAVQDELVEGVDTGSLMVTTLEDLVWRTEELHADEAALTFPDSAGGRALAEQLLDGSTAAKEDLEGFLEEVREIPDPDPEAIQVRREQMVIELEKPRSLVKPDIQGDLGDADLEAAIDAEESCGFVTRD
jgi:hypothetical protein